MIGDIIYTIQYNPKFTHNFKLLFQIEIVLFLMLLLSHNYIIDTYDVYIVIFLFLEVKLS